MYSPHLATWGPKSAGSIKTSATCISYDDNDDNIECIGSWWCCCVSYICFCNIFDFADYDDSDDDDIT